MVCHLLTCLVSFMKSATGLIDIKCYKVLLNHIQVKSILSVHQHKSFMIFILCLTYFFESTIIFWANLTKVFYPAGQFNQDFF